MGIFGGFLFADLFRVKRMARGHDRPRRLCANNECVGQRDRCLVESVNHLRISDLLASTIGPVMSVRINPCKRIVPRNLGTDGTFPRL
jgi:hypothetical protein